MPPEIQIRNDIEIVRLRGMTDEELRRFGKAARSMVSSDANMGKPPVQGFVIQDFAQDTFARANLWLANGYAGLFVE